MGPCRSPRKAGWVSAVDDAEELARWQGVHYSHSKPERPRGRWQGSFKANTVLGVVGGSSWPEVRMEKRYAAL